MRPLGSSCQQNADVDVHIPMPLMNWLSRRSLFLLFALQLGLLNCCGWSQQPSQHRPEIKISVAATKDPNTFTISIRNVSHHGLSLVLGDLCAENIDSVSYRLTNYMLVEVRFAELGRPCGGNVGALMANLAPGECYTYDMHLDETTLAGDDALLHAVTEGKYSYRLQAIVDGQKGINAEEWMGGIDKTAKYPLWRKTAASAWIPFPSPASPDWQSYVKRGGSFRSGAAPSCGAK